MNDETAKESHLVGTRPSLPCKQTNKRVGTGCSTKRARHCDQAEKDQSAADSAGLYILSSVVGVPDAEISQRARRRMEHNPCYPRASKRLQPTNEKQRYKLSFEEPNYMHTASGTQKGWLNASNILSSTCGVVVCVDLYVPCPCEKVVTGRDHLGATESSLLSRPLTRASVRVNTSASAASTMRS